MMIFNRVWDGGRRARSGWRVVGVGGPDGRLVGGRRGDGREPDGAGFMGVIRTRWQGRERMAGGPDSSCWGWCRQEEGGRGKEFHMRARSGG